MQNFRQWRQHTAWELQYMWSTITEHGGNDRNNIEDFKKLIFAEYNDLQHVTYDIIILMGLALVRHRLE